MNKKTTGAWIIHHSHKLQGVTVPGPDYEQLNLAGKCGIMLNALAGSNEAEISSERIAALATANGISFRLEIPVILGELERQRLIDRGEAGVSVLGLTSTQTLEHTANIFEELSPSPSELAAITVSERASDLPLPKHEAFEIVSDTHHISRAETNDILKQSEEIGFFDYEEVSGEKVYFNGNLFRHGDITRAAAVVSSFSALEERKVIELTQSLKATGCMAKQSVISLLGEQLYSKLCAIGFVDENSIGNEGGTFTFITRPAAFSKFTNSVADDAFDLAKAFVTSLTYGMTASPSGRGRIRMIEALMGKLISGLWIGPATAIGHDYRVLEMRGVVEVRPQDGNMFMMRLLKKDVGQLALSVITEGEASSTTLLDLPAVSATKYNGPETNRAILRRRQTEPMKRSVAKLLSDLRTGGLR